MRQLKIVALGIICTFLFTQCVARSKYTELETELNTTQTELAEAQKRAGDLEATLTVSRLDMDGLKKDRVAFEQKCNEMLAAKQNVEEEKETYKQLAESLKKEIAAGEVTLSQMKDRLTVNMIDKVLFDSGQATVKTSGRSTLDKVASVLKDIHEKQIQVNGHTDNVPISQRLIKVFPTNWELSTTRATAVVRYLVEKGVSPDNMVAAGYSMYRPVTKNDSEKDRQENRRIEIALVPKPLPEKTT